MSDPSLMPALEDLPDCDLSYYPDFLSAAAARTLFDHLRETVPWRQDPIRLFGKTYPQPRLTALYGEAGKPYTYSGIRMEPLPFSAELLALKEKLQNFTSSAFTSCLLNLYRDGNDSNGWHADNEKELGEFPVIASLSLGASRVFRLKHRDDSKLKYRMELEHGSLLVMQGRTQQKWLHQIPKTRKATGERINLTFRRIIGSP